VNVKLGLKDWHRRCGSNKIG